MIIHFVIIQAAPKVKKSSKTDDPVADRSVEELMGMIDISSERKSSKLQEKPSKKPMKPSSNGASSNGAGDSFFGDWDDDSIGADWQKLDDFMPETKQVRKWRKGNNQTEAKRNSFLD